MKPPLRLVDGDALCREVGWDLYCDWNYGGQLLQCIYSAEKILAGLVVRGAPSAGERFERRHRDQTR